MAGGRKRPRTSDLSANWRGGYLPTDSPVWAVFRPRSFRHLQSGFVSLLGRGGPGREVYSGMRGHSAPRNAPQGNRPACPIVRPAGALSTGIPMVSRIVEQVTSFALWYVLWQLADHFLKVH